MTGHDDDAATKALLLDGYKFFAASACADTCRGLDPAWGASGETRRLVTTGADYASASYLILECSCQQVLMQQRHRPSSVLLPHLRHTCYILRHHILIR
jgi:hypothetical protein